MISVLRPGEISCWKTRDVLYQFKKKKKKKTKKRLLNGKNAEMLKQFGCREGRISFTSFHRTNYTSICWRWAGWSWCGFELNDHSKEWALEEIRYFLFICSHKPTNVNSIKFVFSNLRRKVLLFAAVTVIGRHNSHKFLLV